MGLGLWRRFCFSYSLGSVCGLMSLHWLPKARVGLCQQLKYIGVIAP